MKFFEICAEVLVPKFTRAEVRLPVFRSLTLSICVGSDIPISDKHFTSTRSDLVAAVSIRGSFDFKTG